MAKAKIQFRAPNLDRESIPFLLHRLKFVSHSHNMCDFNPAAHLLSCLAV